jgi:hypothetical protein
LQQLADELIERGHAAHGVEGDVMDIVVGLRSLGLGKYEAAFRDNDIDETVPASRTRP